MKKKGELYLIVLALVTLILFLIFLITLVLIGLIAISLNASITQYAYVANSNDNTVSIISTATNNVICTNNVSNSPIGVAASSDGKVYITNSDSNSVTIIYWVPVNSTVSVGRNPIGIAVNPDGTKVYVANNGNDTGNTISIIDTADNNVIATVNAGRSPFGVAVNPEGTKVYVTNSRDNTVSIINTTDNTVIAAVSVGKEPRGVAVNPEGTKVYVTNSRDNTVSIIDTADNNVIATVNAGRSPFGVAVNPDGTKVYVTNSRDNTVSIINTINNAVIATVNVGKNPLGVAVTPDGKKLYVANLHSNNISIIDTATNTITGSVDGVNSPSAFGQFIVAFPFYDWVFYPLFFNLAVCMFISSVFALCVTFVAFFVNKIVRKKSFEQINSKLQLKKTPKGQISVMNNIHSYFQKYTFEELLFFNLKFNGIRYFPYCHYFSLALLALIFCSIFYTIAMTIGNFCSLILFAPIPIIIMPMFVFGVINKKAGIGNTPWKKFGIRLFTNTVEIIFIMFLSFLIFVTLIEYFGITQELVTSLIRVNYFDHSLAFFTYLHEFKIESVESNQLSLAGFYFTLAIGGTVVLSIIDRYFEEEEFLRSKLLNQVNIFNEVNFESLGLNLSDIINFSYISTKLRKLNIKEIINFTNVKKFEDILSHIQTKLECAAIKNMRTRTDIYEIYIYLIIGTYIIGLIVILAPKELATIFLWIFVIDSVCFGLLIYNIYINYRK